ncbi:MAG TPA: RHS repeat-associated core domain-containing protein [candidate division Zixibacteria bacterium]|nr:RHS repeat-associated core domain-containing protein [candidate division Zixibacteria bacterium]
MNTDDRRNDKNTNLCKYVKICVPYRADDSNGNRKDTADWDKAGAVQNNLTYTSNQLNQYELIINDIGQPADSFTFDTDGNLTSISDGTTTTQYTFNAENRLISVKPETPSDNDTKVEFTYDYMGRRVKKDVYSYLAGNWELNAESLFLYDGWNLIEELVTRNSQLETRYFVWGLDLSQSLQGAGGIGGLITAIEGVDSYQYAYDGNGNVGQLINTSNGSIAAHYEYDPYGNELVANGPEAKSNSYRFSTKYFDEETDLYYYGFRYYSAEMGRWLSRDPIGEDGGVNLYIFNVNNPNNFVDPRGNDSWPNLESLRRFEDLILHGSRPKTGFPVGEPWIEFPTYKVHIKEKRLNEESLGKSKIWRGLFSSLYKRVDVDWEVNYEVAAERWIDIQIAGKSARGKIDDQGSVYSILQEYWSSPDDGLIEQIHEKLKENKRFLCRKRVVCCTKCECGKSVWTARWQPNKEESQYLLGNTKNYPLAGRPYCELPPYLIKDVCTSLEAKKACKEVP